MSQNVDCPGDEMLKSKIMLLLTLIALPAMANAEIYKWKDGDVWRYADSPPKGKKYEPLKSQKPGNGSVAPSVGEQAKNTSTNLQSTGDKAPAESGQSQKELKEKACANAKENLKKLKQGSIVYKENAKGEREYLDETSMKTEAAAAEKEVAATCT